MTDLPATKVSTKGDAECHAEGVAEAVADVADSPLPTRGRRAMRGLGLLAGWLLLVAVVACLIDGGLRLRRWTFEQSEPVHFTPDINRGYGWGREAIGPQGLLNLYDKMAREKANWSYFLDYAPLRLAVMRQWAHVNAATQPRPEKWRADYAFNRPVLWFNAGFELVGVFAAFFLVRRWVRRGDEAGPTRSWTYEAWDRCLGRTIAVPVSSATVHRPFRGWPQGFVAATLLWFNPAMILSAHGWPTWDAWVIPPFLLGLLLASYGRWFWAGVVIGLGTMFKGQQLVGAGVFVAWTLLNGDWRNALRWAGGLLIAICAVALPWLTTLIPPAELGALYAAQAKVVSSPQIAPFVADRVWNVPNLVWAVGVTAVAAALPSARRSALRRLRYGAVVLAAALVLCPLAVRHDRVATTTVVLAFVALVLAARFVRRWPDRMTLAGVAFVSALLAGVYFFDASLAWWTVGVAYGSDHYQGLVVGFTDNLPGLMHERWGWREVDDVVFTAAGHAVTVKQFTRGLFVLTLVPIFWSVARHARRGDPRFLVAAVAPWLAFYCLPTQIHERYLLFAAASACVWIGQSVGMTLLGVMLTVFTFVQTLMVMLAVPGNAAGLGPVMQRWAPTLFTKTSGLTLNAYLRPTFPDLAYANLLALLIVLYVAVTSTRKPDSVIT